MAAIIPKFLTGYRLVRGEDLNTIVDDVNNINGNGTPQPGTFTTINASGVITATGGVKNASGGTFRWANGGSVALATSGTDTACSNGDRYWVGVSLDVNATLTGISYLIGSVGGTDKVIVELRNTAGVLVATSALAGATVGTAANLQSVDFIAPVAVTAGQYYAVVQFNGTTAKFRTYPIPGSPFVASTAAGTFGTPVASITPGTTFTASKGPICLTY